MNKCTPHGWEVQDAAAANLGAARGVAIREFPLAPGYGVADYLLYADGRAVGVVEAKKEGTTLSGIEPQTAKYSAGLPAHVPAWHRPLPFPNESTGVETWFTNRVYPDPRSRRLPCQTQPVSATLARVTLQRLDHVGVVVDDLAAAVAFFVELGLELEGQMTVEGRVVDRINGLDGVRSDIAMLRTPDGRSRLEFAKYNTPPGPAGDPRAPANTPGIRHLCFAVQGIDEVLDRLRPHGAELVGHLERYEDSYRLCYVRGPAGIIVELAEQLT
jgi:catechol 2,3-dioxygenase-like lactoylglutathione lyase family enzyme